MSMLKNVISGEGRITRLHDEKNNLISVKRLLLHSPLAIASGVLRVASGYRPQLPWISYSAIDALEKYLTKSSRVLEFGSGMSTIYYAKHAGEVSSVEDCKPWFDKISCLIKNKKLDNINYKFAKNSQEYCTYMSNNKAAFDLVMIDGSYRSDCMVNAVKLIKPGGILYLDNSDKDSTPKGGDMRLAEESALKFASERGAKLVYFTDFSPTQLFVEQGLMVKLPSEMCSG